MDTTVFSTHCCLKLPRRPDSDAVPARALCSTQPAASSHLAHFYRFLLVLTTAWLTAVGLPSYAAEGNNAEISALRVEHNDEGFYLSAALIFELPVAVEEAMLKGVPVSFVSEVQVYRDRWYWYDKRIATATRTVRLGYQPLTRRWRVGVVSGTVASPATGNALTQHFDSLAEALATVRRVARWKIADTADIDPQARYNMEYSFKLDLSQLPRPLQIGVSGQSDWDINVQRYLRPEPKLEPRNDQR